MSRHALEKHKLFPFIAWMLVISFTVFVYSIIIDLKNTTSSLEKTASNLEMKTKQNAADIDFTTAR